MRLTTKTDYCIRVLIFLQQQSRRVKIQEIAEAYEISKNHLSVAVNRLSELGYVTSTSGPKGGIELNLNFIDHSLYDLVSKLECFDIAQCFNSALPTCKLSSTCKLKAMLGRATQAFLDELKNYQIKDLK